MLIDLLPGKYIVAVSGGVDSVVLLHLLQSRQDLALTVAHFDHGIREDSAEDERFVRGLAAVYGIPYVTRRVALGATASEAAARQARYDFLYSERTAAGADGVITAHHQDDVLETAIFNIIRGTGRKGLSSLKSSDGLRRPLLGVSKVEIVDYAVQNELGWHEDSTNLNDAYKRNYIRHNILPRFSTGDRQRFSELLAGVASLNQKIAVSLNEFVTGHTSEKGLRRQPFVVLPHAVAREIMAEWITRQGITEIDTMMIERLVHGAKTFAIGKQINISGNAFLMVKKDCLALQRIERYNSLVYG